MSSSIHTQLMALFEQRIASLPGEYLIPPPSFVFMGADVLAFDQAAATLTVRFPVRPEYLNPYAAMQGGLIAGAVDNTLGPLSMLVAPPNVTRKLEIKYSTPVRLEMEHIDVHGRLKDRDGHWLTFQADVRTREGKLLARAEAQHFIVDISPVDPNEIPK